MSEQRLEDQSGVVRWVGRILGLPAGLPTGWTEDASSPANVSSNGGGLSLGAGTLGADDGAGSLAAVGSAGVTAVGPGGLSTRLVPSEGVKSQPPAGVPAFSAFGAAGATVALDAGGLLASNVHDPAGAQDAATKAYTDAAAALKAPLASPVFTGDPHAPLAAFGDKSASIATTAFVAAILTDANGPPGAGFVSALYYDHTAVTGGLYAWDGAAYVKVSPVA